MSHHSENELRQKVKRYLWRQGYSIRQRSFTADRMLSKESLRALHIPQRKLRLEKEADFLVTRGLQQLNRFAEGNEIIPEKVVPKLIPIKAGTEDADLFRMATLLWSVPTSQGFGRRLRYLVMDNQNGKLIGIFALGDPVFNLSARDNWIGWNLEQKTESLVNVLDAYVLGAVPPYSNLLGGKLIGGLLGSLEISNLFQKKYGDSVSVISRRKKNPILALVTTTSALGRSSLYNRLNIRGQLRFSKVGETKGYGYFHLDGSLFNEIKDFLEERDHPYVKSNRFGQGPNWRLRILRAGLQALDLPTELLHHGIQREVYILSLIENPKDYLLGKLPSPKSLCLPSSDIADFWRERWLIPRASRDCSYQTVRREDIINSMVSVSPKVCSRLRRLGMEIQTKQ